MLSWMAENAGTLLVAALLIVAVTAIVLLLVRDKRKGKSTCGANCAHCAMAGSCHKQKSK